MRPTEHLYFRKIVGMDWLLGHRSPGQIQPNCVAPWHAVDDEPTIRHLFDREGERLGALISRSGEFFPNPAPPLADTLKFFAVPI